jgi:hypothetical protein
MHRVTEKFMSHGPQRFRKSEVRRLIKAAQSAGVEIGRLEADPDGRVALIPSKPDEGDNDNASAVNPWDEVLTNVADKGRAA